MIHICMIKRRASLICNFSFCESFFEIYLQKHPLNNKANQITHPEKIWEKLPYTLHVENRPVSLGR